VHTIEGNKRNKVMRGKYPVGYAKIMGYGRPAYPEEGYDDYGTGKDYLDKVKEMGDAIVSEKWIYSNQNVSRTFHGAESGNNRKTNCAHAISMSMQLFGTLKKGQTFYTNNSGHIVANSVVREQIKKNYEVIKVDAKRNAKGVDLKPGDICLWNAHVSVYVGKTSDGKNQWYDFGKHSTTKPRSEGGTYTTYVRNGNPGQTLYQIYRLKDAQSYGSGKKTVVPKPYGTKYSFMGWTTLKTPGTPQMHLKDRTGEHYDSHGFAKVGDRYVIACTTTFGQVGDELDVVLENGNVIHAVMGDEKSQKDSWCNKWGHSLDETAEHAGEVVVEFVVNKGQWYGIRDNPYITQTHPEWKSRVNFIMNLGKNDIPKS
ncbi:MAG: hypothetical protein U0K57_02360, partial [Lachnospiraceae bacterium]|nr:hypothetical protein [Lachnospiraceae bacterium]